MFFCVSDWSFVFAFQNTQKKYEYQKNVSPIPLTWIAILPINFYKGNIIMKNVHLILTILRFIEHGTLLVPSFILFNDHNDYNILGFKIYIFVSFVIVFGLYYYIVVYDEYATQNEPTSTNRTFQQLFDLSLFDEIVEMYVFGFKHNDQDWRKLVQNKNIHNRHIAGALTTFLSRNVIDMDEIFSCIEPVVNVQDRDERTILHGATNDDFGSVECVSKLLQHMADPNVKDKNGHTSLHSTVCYSTGKDRLAKLSLLLQAGADVNATQKHDHTALHLAAYHIHRYDCIEVLLGASNVNINEMGKQGKTALDLAYEAKRKVQENGFIGNNTISKLISAGGVRGSEIDSIKQTGDI